MSKGPFSSINFLVLSTSEIFISRHFVFHPFKFISSETSVKVSNLREAIVTNAPLEAKAQAHAMPIPDEAPTTNAFFPIKLKDGVSGRTITSIPFKYSVSCGR